MNNNNMGQKNACVVVLGDIGRSPRMQYHAESLAENGYKVDIICYKETSPKPSLAAQPQVSFHYLAPYPNLGIPKIINYLFKTLWQAFTLFFVMFIIRKPTTVLVQNPPAIPALPICWLFSLIVRAQFVIDWHNYANTIMALSVGKNHMLVKLTKYIESFIGRKATKNLCVTKEMKADLKNQWGITATTLYDRPSEIFKPISIEEKHNLLKKLSTQYDEFKGKTENETVITKFYLNDYTLKIDRPGIIISSTSWTEDEDFSVLLKALEDYELHKCNGNKLCLPDLLCIITGKGPLKDFYINKINKLSWNFVKIVTPWLESEDYPKIVATADLGVSLHTSSSGLDLPMKVVDMFGCAVPVCAYNFCCLHELVKHQVNSFVFDSPEELASQIQDWFERFPNNEKQTATRKDFIKELDNFRNLGWKENWNMTALNIFQT